MEQTHPESGAPGPASIPIYLADTPSTPSTVSLPSIGDIVGEHYELVGTLGAGTFGKVYVAHRLDVPEHQVALKLMPRSLYASRNVERELVMLATVGHPNVVQLKDHGTTPDYVWLTMPVYRGETLAERLERGTLSPRQAHDVFVPIARGLEALHDAGLRHQDVKPENIFLAVFGGRVHPILLDLGVAAEVDATFVAGTALYAAPEQVAVLSGFPSFASLSAKMDTYGLASTLLRALVGRSCYPGESAHTREQLAAAHEERTTQPLHDDALPDVTGAPRELIASAFRRWLALQPSARPTMSELADELEVLLEPERAEEQLFERSLRRQKTSLRRIRAVVLAMLVIGAGGAALAYTKRETLQLASQLDTLRRTRKESFEKLDMCSASYWMTRQELDTCLASRDKDRIDFKQALDEVKRTGTSTAAERAREAQRYGTRIKACEDDALASRRRYEDEVAESLRQRTSLGAEQDELQSTVQMQKAEIATLVAERDATRTDRVSCSNELQSCRAAIAATDAARVASSRPPRDLAHDHAASSASASTTPADPVAGPAPFVPETSLRAVVSLPSSSPPGAPASAAPAP